MESVPNTISTTGTTSGKPLALPRLKWSLQRPSPRQPLLLLLQQQQQQRKQGLCSSATQPSLSSPPTCGHFNDAEKNAPPVPVSADEDDDDATMSLSGDEELDGP